MPIDFLRLYEELDLPPDTNIDGLKQAYRRRVSQLHPDRPLRADASRARQRTDELQRLTALYGAAIQFHRRHGRLPGAAAPSRASSARAHLREPAALNGPRRSPRTLLWMIALVAFGSWLMLRDPAGVDDPGSANGATSAATPAPAPLGRGHEPAKAALMPLKTGMPSSDVLAVEGEPVTRSDERWTYGPSWIAFEQDKVTSWYSSPLRPLKGARRH